MTYKMLDCFCGMGGVSDGFYKMGFDVTGIDIVDAPEMLGYKHKFIKADLTTIQVHQEYYKQFDVIWGSPPCRNFTILNDSRWKHKKNPAEGLICVNAFLRLVDAAKPKIWIMENVFGLRKHLNIRPKIYLAKIGGKRHVFYGNFKPFLLYETSKFKIRESNGWDKLAHWKRSKIPIGCSQQFATNILYQLIDRKSEGVT